MFLDSEIAMEKESKLTEIHVSKPAPPQKAPIFALVFFTILGTHFSLSASVWLDGLAKCLAKRP